LSWCRVALHDEDRIFEGLNAISYRFTARGTPAPERLVPIDGPIVPDRIACVGEERFGVVYGPASDDAWWPTGLTHWVMDTDTDDAHGDATELETASLSEDRRWLAALWLLAAQPLSDSRVERAPRGAARRSARAKVASDVRLVDLRRRAGERHDEHEPSEPGSRRSYSYRFIVGGESGGFWRQQACGPGWSQHRPVWIEPFVKGPKNKPLKLREIVKIVRGDP
jgi:hypothetical protein